MSVVLTNPNNIEFCKPQKFLMAEERRRRFFYTAPAGVSLEDVLQPGYWQPVVVHLRAHPWTLIEIVSEAGDWEALLRCYATTDHSAKVRVLWKWVDDRTFVRPTLPEGYAVELLPGQGWRAVDNKNVEICRGQMVEAEALIAAAAHAAKAEAGAAIDARLADNVEGEAPSRSRPRSRSHQQAD